MDKDMFKKLIEERPLTAEEALTLDELLEGETSRQVAHMVAAQHDDAPSLTWRSKLNQKLSLLTGKKRRTLVWRLGAAVSTGAVAALFFMAVLNQPVTPDPRIASPHDVNYASDETTLEESIMDDHETSMTRVSLGVYGSYGNNSDF